MCDVLIISTWESRLPRIVAMINSVGADIVCLQEVSCSNSNSAELERSAQPGNGPKKLLEPLIGRTGELAKKLEGRAKSLRDQIRDFFNSSFLEDNPETRDLEFRKLSAILNCKFEQPITDKQLKQFYSSPIKENVKAVIVKKVRSPIFEDAASKVHPEVAKKHEPTKKTASSLELYAKSALAKVKESNPSMSAADLDKIVAAEWKAQPEAIKAAFDSAAASLKDAAKAAAANATFIREIKELRQKVKLLQEVACGDCNVDQRKREVFRLSKVTPALKIVGYRYFLVVVIKSGIRVVLSFSVAPLS